MVLTNLILGISKGCLVGNTLVRWNCRLKKVVRGARRNEVPRLVEPSYSGVHVARGRNGTGATLQRECSARCRKPGSSKHTTDENPIAETRSILEGGMYSVFLTHIWSILSALYRLWRRRDQGIKRGYMMTGNEYYEKDDDTYDKNQEIDEPSNSLNR
jgi:hypothetical protein